ncbi:hypothetical protein LDENG_00207940 [Lucifuga dentata]|nr:hypothetical protein LDENG_00207940 [Lucifuga dentata]
MSVTVSALFVAFFALLACEQVLCVDHQDDADDSLNVYRRRLSQQNTAEIQSCFLSSADVGCGTFQCFSNNSCEIRGLNHICVTLLLNAGAYDSQGKSFVKESLRCLALGLRQRFSCVSSRCTAIREMVSLLQRECYSKHQLCLAVRDHMHTIANLVQFHLLLPTGPYVELVNFLLSCGNDVRVWVSQRLCAQCEQQWGVLCSIFNSDTCALNQPDALQYTTIIPSPMPQPLTEGSLHQPTRAADPEERSNVSVIHNATESGSLETETTNITAS